MGPPYSDGQQLGGVSRFADRPTISYNLLTVETFARRLMSPIKPTSVMSLVEGGYPIDLVFRLLGLKEAGNEFRVGYG